MLHEVITLLTGGLLLPVNLDYLVDIWSVLFPNEIRASLRKPTVSQPPVKLLELVFENHFSV